jgi:hypothetical protein
MPARRSGGKRRADASLVRGPGECQDPPSRTAQALDQRDAVDGGAVGFAVEVEVEEDDAGLHRCGGDEDALAAAHGVPPGLQAYFVQSLLGADGLPLTPAHLLYLATRAGAEALDLGEQVGDLSVGKQFDAVWLRPEAGSTLDVVLGHADDVDDALAKVFALGGPADVRGVWVGGDRLR